MLEAIFLRYLTKKGKIIYFVGQILLLGLLAFYILGIAGYSMEEGKDLIFGGMVIIILIWASICYAFWRKTEGEEEESTVSKRD